MMNTVSVAMMPREGKKTIGYDEGEMTMRGNALHRFEPILLRL
jgi:hypothetical protein